MIQPRYFTNGPPSTLASGLSSVTPGASGTVVVASNTDWPDQINAGNVPFTLLADWGNASFEVITVTQPATGTGPFTYANCVRGDDSTLAPSHNSGATVVPGFSARDANQWSKAMPRSAVTVSPTGLGGGAPASNNGAMFGPDTAGTTTQGLQEAVTYAVGLVTGLSGSVSPPVVLLLPGKFNISSTINVPVPVGTGTNSVGFEMAGSGHFATQLLISGGQGILFGKYAWQDVCFRNMSISQVTGSSPTSLIAMVGSGSSFPGLNSMMMFTNVWFEMPVDYTTLPSNGAIYFGPFSGQTGGFTCFFTNSVIAGSFSINSPFETAFNNCLICSGNNVALLTNAPITNIGPGCLFFGQVQLTTHGCTVNVEGAQWYTQNFAAMVSSAQTTDTTYVKVRDSYIVFGHASGAGAIVSQPANPIEMHLDGNLVNVVNGSPYTLVTGGCYATRTTKVASNYYGTYAGVGNFIQGSTLPANPPVSGTIYQNPYSIAIQVAVPVTYNPTSGAAATCTLNLGPQNGFGSAFAADSAPANSTTGFVRNMMFRVPAGWWYELVTVNATIGTAAVLPEQ